MIVGGITVLTMSLGSSSALIPGLATSVLFICAYLFRSLTVRVSRDRVTLRFGPGLIRKSFDTINICNAGIVQNRWYYGWGIKLTPHGWLTMSQGLTLFKSSSRMAASTELAAISPKTCLRRSRQ